MYTEYIETPACSLLSMRRKEQPCFTTKEMMSGLMSPSFTTRTPLQ